MHFKTLLPILALGSVACAAPLERRAIVEGELGQGLQDGLNSGTLPKVAGPDGVLAGPTGEGLLTALTNVINGVAGPVSGEKVKRAVVEGELGSSLETGLNQGVLDKVAGTDGIIQGNTGTGLNEALTNVISSLLGAAQSQKEKRAIIEGTLGDNLNTGLNSGTLPKVAGPDGIIAGPTGEGLLTALTNVINGVAGPVGAQ
ncbi:uncharacterized protein JCM10292_001251 [Rhodotorula paludigena]|uniref:uncharacterized protein n=1 Tax=Rhodotorula paludigena TaxID=86838 RepID=UPI0031801B38